MLHIYGTPLSSPTNKVRYVANYLGIPNEFHSVNLSAGEQRKPEYLKINPLGRVPAIDDNGFKLAESNAIVRYLANKQQSPLYPSDLQQRAIVDQWIDYASQHVMMSLSRIMYNTYFYKFTGVEKDERSLQDGRKFIAEYLPQVEKQLSKHAFITGDKITLADLVMLAALDVVETCQVDLSPFSYITAWRNNLMKEAFYKNCHESYAVAFNKILAIFNARVV
jgi:glutathione S-transferase